MRAIALHVGLVALVATLAARPAIGQTYSCLPDTSITTINLKDYMLRLTSGADTSYEATRQQYQLPLAPATQVQVVTRTKTCKAAAQAYHRAVRGAAAPPISRSVAVIKVGSSRYVVLDPTEHEGEYQVTVIFNGSFQSLAAFNS
jgi:hypothetical protein